MPYCPNCNAEREGEFCSICGARLQASPAAGPLVEQKRGDTGLDRSVSQTVVVASSGAPDQEASLAWDFCAIDGLYVRRDRTFRCRQCGRDHLCREHLDPELRVCEECAAEIRGSDQQALEARLAALRAEVGAHLEGGNLAGALLACGRALALATEDAPALRLVEEAKEALRGLEGELARWRGAAEEAQARSARLEADLRQAEAAREGAQGEGEDLARELARVQADLAHWRQAAEDAQARLAEIEERERAAEEARRRAEEEARKAPLWRQIGIEMVTIPARQFLYGEDRQKAHLPEYWLARTPVTNAQYRAFVEATGYRAPDHWEKGNIAVSKEDQPVVNVSWEDAAAFCQWAGCRLPTEQEWEKGARGTDGREYPWGDGWEAGRRNTKEAGVGDTTPVGGYPNGASPYGLLDMAGNVWEWCDNWSDSERKYKALRGGSWYRDRGRARCAIRYWDLPVIRYFSMGFRCCLSPTSSP